MILKYFGKETRFSNFMFKALLVFTVGQQIYFPQKYKYFHLAILFMYFLFLDIYKEDSRDVKREYQFLVVIFISGIMSILDYLIPLNLGFIYLVLLLVAIVQSLLFLWGLINVFRNKENYYMISEANKKVVDKNPKFVIGLLSIISLLLIFSFIYTLYQLAIIILNI